MNVEELEKLFVLLKKHHVYVFQSGEVKVQFAVDAFVPEAATLQEDKPEPTTPEAARAEFESVLYAASGG